MPSWTSLPQRCPTVAKGYIPRGRPYRSLTDLGLGGGDPRFSGYPRLAGGSTGARRESSKELNGPMRGGAIADTETRADRRARVRLRKVAGEWFPSIADDVLDRIVATAWIEGRAENAGGDRTAVAAAAAVRRYGLRALRGDEVSLPADAEARIAALNADDPSEPRLRTERFRRRPRPEALGRRAPEARPSEPLDVSGPVVRKIDPDAEIEHPPTRRRRARHSDEPRVDPADEPATPRSGPLRILADT